MRSAVHAALFVTLLSYLPACGDKLDPATPETEGTEETGTPTTPASNSNSVVTNPNVANPNEAIAPDPAPPASTKTLCGTNATTISYATHVSSLVNARCGGCHGAGGKPPVMTNFTNTKSAFVSTTARDQVDTGSMPQGSSLNANQKCIILTWTDTGYAP